jgi:hypothetical protein
MGINSQEFYADFKNVNLPKRQNIRNKGKIKEPFSKAKIWLSFLQFYFFWGHIIPKVNLHF